MYKKVSGAIILVAGLCFTAQAASSSWNVDADSQWTNALSWTAGVPGSTTLTNSADVAAFSTALTANRTVTVDANRNIGGITFGNTGTTGYTLAGGTTKLSNGGVIQSLSGMGGTNKVTALVSLMGDGTYSANATSANGALVIGAVIGVAGKTLTLDGTSTATNTVSSIRTVLSVVKNGTGYWQLNGSVNDFNGLTLNDGTLASGGDGKLGTNTVTINGGTLTSISSAARIWTNAFVVNNNFTLGQATGGTGALTLSGAMNLGGGVRTIAMSNVTASGDFFLGIISNGGINKTGLCTMVLSNANTYAGGTIVSAGTLTGAANAAFGTGDITVAGGAKLTLTNSVSSNFINDTAKLILGTNSTLNLVFTGTDTIGGLSLDGGSTWLAGGTYNVAALTAAGGLGTYTGGGSLTVPASNRTLGLYIIQ